MQVKETKDHETNSSYVQVITGDFWEKKIGEWFNPFPPGKGRSKTMGRVWRQTHTSRVGTTQKAKGLIFLEGIKMESERTGGTF